jgi:hypothetical protein
LELYRQLSSGEKALVWVVGAALVVLLVGLGNASQGVAAAAQVVAGIGTLVLAILARAQVNEMREARIAQDRPQVIVDVDHSRPPFVFLVVRNIGRGAAKNVSFEFSAPVEAPEAADTPGWLPINEQPFFARGVDYLAPGVELSFFWGSMITLADFLEERGLHGGVKITSRYESLAGERQETPWTVNPLLMQDRLSTESDPGMKELVEAVQAMRNDLHRVVSLRDKELRISTVSERQERRENRSNDQREE